MEIIGHKKIIDVFTRAIEHDHLHHAYCIVGPAHVGKRTLVEEISTRLFNVEREKVSSVPDFFVLKRDTDKKTGKTKKDISVAQVRSFIETLSRSAFTPGGYTVGLIDDSQYMNVYAANAFLKTLEEPTKKTVLFLTTTDEQSLPSTIRSRCQMIYLYPANEQEITEGLVLEGASKEKAGELALLSNGLPGRALSWLIDEEALDKHKNEVSRFNNFLGKPFFAKLEAVEDLFGDKTDPIATRAQIIETLGLWRICVRDMWSSKKLESSQVLSIDDAITRAQKELSKNIHPRLLVENILLRIP
jgi:DNA polymerase III delta prime subunit